MATVPARPRAVLGLGLVYRPLPHRSLAAGSLLIVVGTALYCIAYNWAQGTSESLAGAIGWSLANMVPWLLAFELGKRFLDDPEHGPANLLLSFTEIIAGTIIASMVLEWVVAGEPGWAGVRPLLFEMLRRVPGALLVGSLLLFRPRLEQSEAAEAAVVTHAERGANFLPLLPRQIAWIKAAGNYLEIRSDHPTILCRMTMKQAEGELASEGFIRVHRSALVNKRHIASVRPGKLYDEVQLLDGSWLRVGGAFRPKVAEFARTLRGG